MAAALARVLGRRSLRVAAAPLLRSQVGCSQIRHSSDHGHHGPVIYDPPFYRLPPPSKPLHEQDELIWNDGVAPETAIDFDAPHLSAGYGLLWWLGGFGFFYSVYAFAKATAHPLNKPSASRDLPEGTTTTALGAHEHGKF